MVRSAVAEESLLNYLVNLAKSDVCSVGLILGQPSPTRDYVIHFAKTPPCDEDKQSLKVKPVRSINDYLDVWVADHAKHATRMLPGGMYVLGIFVVSQDDLLAPFSPKIKSILNKIHKQLSINNFLHGNPDNSERIVVNLSSKTLTYAIKCYDPTTSIVRPAELKFQPKPTKWKQLECRYELNQVFPLPENDIDFSLKQHMTDIMEMLKVNLKSAIFALDGEIREPDEHIEGLDKKKKLQTKLNDAPISVSVYLPCDCKEISQPVNVLNYGGHIKLTGQVACKIWLNPKATVRAATKALTEDLVRSLAARLDMHWDSLIEEEHGSPEDTNSIHEPPRRVLVQLPNSEVTLSDYLFPGEGPQEAQISLQELLDIRVAEKDTIKDIEGQADLVDMYNETLESESHEGAGKQPETSKMMYILGLGVAFTVLVVSIIIHLLRTYYV
ncbi:Odorant response abnormal 4-like [Popillia japonica]|uniref:Odorant response abnormal 4-like n=1 Tax=Popillia japonica TaxID=7064 RepID=A0AAW1M2S7_POPJA